MKEQGADSNAVENIDNKSDQYDGEYARFKAVRIRSIDDLIFRFKLLTVADLKKQLKSVGLRPRGLKRDLVKQLAEKEYNRMVLYIVVVLLIVYRMETVPCLQISS